MDLELECLVDVAGTAEWRSRKAEQYPEDSRNVEASRLLDRVAEELPHLEGSPIHRKLLELYFERSPDEGPRSTKS